MPSSAPSRWDLPMQRQSDYFRSHGHGANDDNHVATSSSSSKGQNRNRNSGSSRNRNTRSRSSESNSSNNNGVLTMLNGVNRVVSRSSSSSSRSSSSFSSSNSVTNNTAGMIGTENENDNMRVVRNSHTVIAHETGTDNDINNGNSRGAISTEMENDNRANSGSDDSIENNVSVGVSNSGNGQVGVHTKDRAAEQDVNGNVHCSSGNDDNPALRQMWLQDDDDDDEEEEEDDVNSTATVLNYGFLRRQRTPRAWTRTDNHPLAMLGMPQGLRRVKCRSNSYRQWEVEGLQTLQRSISLPDVSREADRQAPTDLLADDDFEDVGNVSVDVITGRESDDATASNTVHHRLDSDSASVSVNPPSAVQDSSAAQRPYHGDVSSGCSSSSSSEDEKEKARRSKFNRKVHTDSTVPRPTPPGGNKRWFRLPTFHCSALLRGSRGLANRYRGGCSRGGGFVDWRSTPFMRGPRDDQHQQRSSWPRSDRDGPGGPGFYGQPGGGFSFRGRHDVDRRPPPFPYHRMAGPGMTGGGGGNPPGMGPCGAFDGWRGGRGGIHPAMRPNNYYAYLPSARHAFHRPGVATRGSLLHRNLAATLGGTAFHRPGVATRGRLLHRNCAATLGGTAFHRPGDRNCAATRGGYPGLFSEARGGAAGTGSSVFRGGRINGWGSRGRGISGLERGTSSPRGRGGSFSGRDGRGVCTGGGRDVWLTAGRGRGGFNVHNRGGDIIRQSPTTFNRGKNVRFQKERPAGFKSGERNAVNPSLECQNHDAPTSSVRLNVEEKDGEKSPPPLRQAEEEASSQNPHAIASVSTCGPLPAAESEEGDDSAAGQTDTPPDATLAPCSRVRPSQQPDGSTPGKRDTSPASHRSQTPRWVGDIDDIDDVDLIEDECPAGGKAAEQAVYVTATDEFKAGSQNGFQASKQDGHYFPVGQKTAGEHDARNHPNREPEHNNRRQSNQEPAHAGKSHSNRETEHTGRSHSNQEPEHNGKSHSNRQSNSEVKYPCRGPHLAAWSGQRNARPTPRPRQGPFFSPQPARGAGQNRDYQHTSADTRLLVPPPDAALEIMSRGLGQNQLAESRTRSVVDDGVKKNHRAVVPGDMDSLRQIAKASKEHRRKRAGDGHHNTDPTPRPHGNNNQPDWMARFNPSRSDKHPTPIEAIPSRGRRFDAVRCGDQRPANLHTPGYGPIGVWPREQVIGGVGPASQQDAVDRQQQTPRQAFVADEFSEHTPVSSPMTMTSKQLFAELLDEVNDVMQAAPPEDNELRRHHQKKPDPPHKFSQNQSRADAQLLESLRNSLKIMNDLENQKRAERDILDQHVEITRNSKWLAKRQVQPQPAIHTTGTHKPDADRGIFHNGIVMAVLDGTPSAHVLPTIGGQHYNAGAYDHLVAHQPNHPVDLRVRPTAVQQDRPTTVQQDLTTAFQQDLTTAFQQDRPTTFQQDRPTAVQQDRPTALQQNSHTTFQQDRPTAVQQDRPTAVQQDHPTAVQQDRPTAVQQDRPMDFQHDRKASPPHPHGLQPLAAPFHPATTTPYTPAATTPFTPAIPASWFLAPHAAPPPPVTPAPFPVSMPSTQFHPNVPATFHPSVPTTFHPNVATPFHPNVPTPFHHSTALPFYYPNGPIPYPIATPNPFLPGAPPTLYHPNPALTQFHQDDPCRQLQRGIATLSQFHRDTPSPFHQGASNQFPPLPPAAGAHTPYPQSGAFQLPPPSQHVLPVEVNQGATLASQFSLAQPSLVVTDPASSTQLGFAGAGEAFEGYAGANGFLAQPSLVPNPASNPQGFTGAAGFIAQPLLVTDPASSQEGYAGADGVVAQSSLIADHASAQQGYTGADGFLAQPSLVAEQAFAGAYGVLLAQPSLITDPASTQQDYTGAHGSQQDSVCPTPELAVAAPNRKRGGFAGNHPVMWFDTTLPARGDPRGNSGLFVPPPPDGMYPL